MHRIVVMSLVLAGAASAEPLANLGAAKPPVLVHGTSPAATPLATKTLPLFVGDRSFAVLVPDATSSSSDFEVAVTKGTAKAHRFDGAPAADLAYAIVDVDLGAPPSSADAVLDANIRAAIASANGKLDGAIDKAAVGSLRARIARVKLDDGAVLIVRFVLDGQALVGVIAGDASSRPDAK